MSLWLVTPAWQRVELSAVCLEQHQRVIATLAAAGVEAHSVVVADDANLDVARALGMHTVERPNTGPDGTVWLTRKFNDGQEYAGKHGAEWIVPIGSDSFVDPAYFLPLPDARFARTSAMYAPVTLDRLAELRVGVFGAGPHMVHRSLMEPVAFRPAPENLGRNTDSNMLAGLARQPRWEWRDLHPLQYVGFRHPPFITQYARLWRRWGKVERTDPWERLKHVYPADLVERARTMLAAAEVAA